MDSEHALSLTRSQSLLHALVELPRSNDCYSPTAAAREPLLTRSRPVQGYLGELLTAPVEESLPGSQRLPVGAAKLWVPSRQPPLGTPILLP